MIDKPKLPFAPPRVLDECVLVEEIRVPDGLDQSPNFGGARFKVPVGMQTTAHRHRQPEIWFVKSGFGELLYEDRLLNVKSGDFLYLEPNRSHMVRNSGDSDLEILSIWFNYQ